MWNVERAPVGHMDREWAKWSGTVSGAELLDRHSVIS